MKRVARRRRQAMGDRRVGVEIRPGGRGVGCAGAGGGNRFREPGAPRSVLHDEDAGRHLLDDPGELGGHRLVEFRRNIEPIDRTLVDPKPAAMRLGSAFQKVNFLRDLQADQEGMGRTYFPSMQLNGLNAVSKNEIQESIENDFADGLKGIKKLPRSARFGVYLAYMYYLALYRKIKTTPPEKVMQARIRIPNRHKATLWAYSFVRYQLNII